MTFLESEYMRKKNEQRPERVRNIFDYTTISRDRYLVLQNEAPRDSAPQPLTTSQVHRYAPQVHTCESQVKKTAIDKGGVQTLYFSQDVGTVNRASWSCLCQTQTTQNQSPRKRKARTAHAEHVYQRSRKKSAV